MSRNIHFLHWSNQPACRRHFTKHYTEYHTLELVTKGSAIVSYDGDSHLLEATTFWFHYPGPLVELRSVKPDTPWHHRHIAFTGPECDSWITKELIARPPISCPTERRSSLIARFDEIREWLDDGRMASLAKAAAAFEVLLWELWEIPRNRGLHGSILPAATAFITEHAFRVGAYDELASELNLSVSSLRRHIREATGMPIHQYARSLRLKEARRLLTQTNKTLAVIASELGFADEYCFSREFSRLAGVPPGAYRQSLV